MAGEQGWSEKLKHGMNGGRISNMGSRRRLKMVVDGFIGREQERKKEDLWKI
jgi:hypothetical protein